MWNTEGGCHAGEEAGMEEWSSVQREPDGLDMVATRGGWEATQDESLCAPESDLTPPCCCLISCIISFTFPVDLMSVCVLESAGLLPSPSDLEF